MQQVPEAPKQVTEKAQPAERAAPYVQESDALRQGLSVPEQSGAWRQILEQIQKPIPASGLSANPVLQEDLSRRQRLLEKMQSETEGALLAGLSLIKSGKALSQTQQNVILRSVARYLDEIGSYQALKGGNKPPLPEFLAPYVRLNERERFAIAVSEYALPLQFDVAESMKLGRSPREIAPRSGEVILGVVRRGLKMEHLLQCLDDKRQPRSGDEPYRQLLVTAGFKADAISADDIAAAKLFVGYIAKRLSYAETMLARVSTVPLRDASVAQVLEYCAFDPTLGEFAKEAVLQIPRVLKGEIPDMREFIRNAFEGAQQYKDKPVELALAPLAQIGPKEEDKRQFQQDGKAVVEFLIGFESKRVSVKNIDQHIQHLNSRQKNLVTGVCNRVCRQETVDAITLSLQIPRDDTKRSAVEKEAIQRLTTLLLQKDINPKDALDIHYLIEMGGGSNPALAFKAVHILQRNGHQTLGTHLQFEYLRKLADAVNLSPDALEENLQRLNVTPEQRREMRNVMMYMKEEGIAEVGNWWDRFMALCTNFPWLIPVFLLAGSGVIGGAAHIGVMAYRFRVKMKWHGIIEFANMTATQKMQFATANGIPVEQVEAAVKATQDLVKQFGDSGKRFNMFRGVTWRDMAGGTVTRPGGLMAEAHVMMRVATMKELSDMAKELGKRKQLGDVAMYLAPLAENEATLERALTDAGYKPADVQTAMQVVRQMTEARQRMEERLDRLGGDEDVDTTVNQPPRPRASDVQLSSDPDLARVQRAALDVKIDLRASDGKGGTRDKTRAELEAEIRAKGRK